MSIRIVCPNCRAAYTVADELRGKKARCRECQTLFLIGAAAPPAAPATPEPIKVEVADDGPPPPPAAPAQNTPPPMVPQPFLPEAGDNEEPLDPNTAADLAKNVPAREPETIVDPPLQAQGKAAPRPPAPDTQQLSPEVVAKVKRATVFLK